MTGLSDLKYFTKRSLCGLTEMFWDTRFHRFVENTIYKHLFCKTLKNTAGLSWAKQILSEMIDVEMGSFTFLVFGTNGGIGKEYKLLLSNLADKLSRKNGESYASAISWLRTRISFEILRSVHTCIRGSRTPFHKNAEFLDDFSVNARNVDIFKLVFSMFS